MQNQLELPLHFGQFLGTCRIGENKDQHNFNVHTGKQILFKLFSHPINCKNALVTSGIVTFFYNPIISDDDNIEKKVCDVTHQHPVNFSQLVSVYENNVLVDLYTNSENSKICGKRVEYYEDAFYLTNVIGNYIIRNRGDAIGFPVL
jgi:hypothetical protein